MTIKQEDFPCYYTDSDGISMRGQKLYKVSNYSILFVLLITTILTSIDTLRELWSPLNKITGVLLMLTSGGAIFLMFYKPEKRWYIGRAVAESLKTLSWRYMMGLPDQPDEISFSDKVTSILNEAKNSGVALTKEYCKHRNIITDKMRDVRSLGLLDRKQCYLDERINNQIAWYSKKSKINRCWAITLSIMIIVLQLGSGVYLIFFIESLKEISPIEIAVFLATSILSIIELNRYKELKESYALTAVDLNIIRNKFGAITDEMSLISFVEEAERAISREHIMWLARKK